ncbi:hypothetical protein EVAR_95714_1 [Eumeta japonica]|uniref:Uncharacterized protein n=1 Tax=Eumeta variegata TaxID=151549 RepID=A0A4C1UKF4_EUMVA|nr:hypothetical protein EVAR_95714_1 [Eumeta japonica]
MTAVLPSYEALLKKFTKVQIDRIYEWFTKKSLQSDDGIDIVTLDQFQEYLAKKPVEPGCFSAPSSQYFLKFLFGFMITDGRVTRRIPPAKARSTTTASRRIAAVGRASRCFPQLKVKHAHMRSLNLHRS